MDTSDITQQNNQTIYEGGYTKTTKTADIFLELSILDAKRINATEQTTAPIIWQMTFKRHLVNHSFNIFDEYLTIASWATKCDPLWNKYYTGSIEGCFPVYRFDNKIVSGINEDVISEEHRVLQVGDKILKYKPFYDERWWFPLDIESNWNQFLSGTHKLHKCKIKRDGKIITVKNLLVNTEYGEFEFWRWGSLDKQ